MLTNLGQRDEPSGNGVNLIGTNNAKVLIQDSVISNNDNTTIDTHASFAVQISGHGNVYLSSSQLIGVGPKLAISGRRLIPLSQVNQDLGLAGQIRNGAGFEFVGRS